MSNEHQSTSLERISVLETEWEQVKTDINDIKLKLDELLHLKSKGLGVLWLITLLIGSSITGVLHNVINTLNKSHL